MIDWDLLARKMGFANEKALLTTLYIDHNLTLTEMSTAFGVTKSCIQRRLVKCNITPRSRGGANHDHNLQEKLRLWDPREVWLAPSLVAKLLQTIPTTVYRLRKEILK